MPDAIEKMISRNKRWIQTKKKGDPDYFANLSGGQSPSVFWLGCCDSRVLPGEILQCPLGEIFVQTNIANQVRTDDAATMGSLEYAVNALKTDHIVVCGHTFCGGIAASMSENALPENLRKWLEPLRDAYRSEKKSLPPGDSERAAALSRINVKRQVETAAGLDFIRNPSGGRRLTVHGWLFRVEEGTVEQLVKIIR